ncbi:F-box domain-containing protein [Ephemerocybe angulata]|uniref:F-box domain-containing protein n=1 Tax=Ephemerocybe angulata TaxID=980116 RepID=A0A8H6HWN9_9AGAR|nr:F-box domain-containing protein [Tulosesus angulatus]
MSDAQYEIDNDDNLFSFDPYDMLSSTSSEGRARAQVEATSRLTPALSMPSHDAPFTSEELDGMAPSSSPTRDKGKQVSMPMPIRPPRSIHDLFDVSPLDPGAFVLAPSSFTPSNFSSFTSSSFTFSSPGSSTGSYQPFASPTFSEVMSSGYQGQASSPSAFSSTFSGKGKGRELPPTLPPLALDSTELGDDDVWMNFDSTQFSGRSSLNSPGPFSAVSEPPTGTPSSACALPSSPPTSVAETEAALQSNEGRLDIPMRTRSLSSLSIDSSTSATTVNPKSKTRNIARKLFFGRKADAGSTRPDTPSGISTAMASEVAEAIQVPMAIAAGNVPRQWYTAPKATEATAIISRPPPPIPILALESATTYPARRGILKHKGRSHSSPLPFSALDVVPITSTDIFEPLPFLVKNYFDDILPRELRLRILGSLIQVHIDAHERMVKSGRWSVNRASASRNQWVGKDKGIRELIKLSRVSRSWRSMVFDGQLWVDVNLRSFPGLPEDVLLRLTEAAGPFIQSLNMTGVASLDAERLLDVASNLCLMSPQESLSFTQLTSVNLHGCTGLTTRSLHHLLIRSRSLTKLDVKGLGAVTNTTCEILATYCPDLASLNMSRCMNMDADGIHYMASAALARGEHLQLKELRVCGLKHATDEMMAALGKAAPHLEVLDLSYARRLHNSALEAFVACDGPGFGAPGVDTVLVSARDLGREVDSDAPYFRRRVTRLRHLNLSFCILLTDTACANLSYSVPRLEFFEMAGIGAGLRDAGLVRLFEQTPYIRRVDLEDAVDIGDTVLAALTPPAPAEEADVASPEPSAAAKRTVSKGAAASPPQTGHALQFLNVSSCLNVTDLGMLPLVRRCPKLTVLEADGTRMGGTLFREFIRLSRERQAVDARIVAVDCRGIGEHLVKEVSGSTRPRLGWRSYLSRRLYYLDERDGNEEDLKIGQDECDEKRVVVKTFYSWQTVDAVKANREKRKAKAAGSSSSGGKRGRDADWDELPGRGGRMRWWSPGGRRGSASGRTSPLAMAEMNEGCRAM